MKSFFRFGKTLMHSYGCWGCSHKVDFYSFVQYTELFYLCFSMRISRFLLLPGLTCFFHTCVSCLLFIKEMLPCLVMCSIALGSSFEILKFWLWIISENVFLPLYVIFLFPYTLLWMNDHTWDLWPFEDAVQVLRRRIDQILFSQMFLKIVRTTYSNSFLLN